MSSLLVLLLICIAALLAFGLYLVYLWRLSDALWARGELCPICGQRVERCPGHEIKN